MRIGIAGCGLLGSVLAYELSKRHYQVTVFEKSASHLQTSCAAAAAGMLCSIAELENALPITFAMGLQASAYWQALLPQLSEPVYFQQNGSITVCHQSDLAELQNYLMLIEKRLPDPALMQRLSRQAIIDLEPALARFSDAVYFPSEACIDNQHLLLALNKSLLEQGVLFHPYAAVKNVTPHTIQLEHVQHQFDWVFDCRGVGAESNFPDVRSVRGELIWLETREVNISRVVRFLHPRYRLYVVPRPNHVYLIGATEIENDDNSPISVRSCLELLSAAVSIHPAFAEARIIKTVNHCRPTLPDGLPRIKHTTGMMAINGLYRHGYLIVGALVMDILKYLENGMNAVNFSPIYEEILNDRNYRQQTNSIN